MVQKDGAFAVSCGLLASMKKAWQVEFVTGTSVLEVDTRRAARQSVETPELWSCTATSTAVIERQSDRSSKPCPTASLFGRLASKRFTTILSNSLTGFVAF